MLKELLTRLNSQLNNEQADEELINELCENGENVCNAISAILTKCKEERLPLPNNYTLKTSKPRLIWGKDAIKQVSPDFLTKQVKLINISKLDKEALTQLIDSGVVVEAKPSIKIVEVK